MSAATITIRDTKDGGLTVELSSFTTDGESTRAAIIATGLVEMLAKVAGTTTELAAIPDQKS